MYANAYPDPRARGKISIATVLPARAANTIPTDLLLSLILDKSLLALAGFAAKHWLLDNGTHVSVAAAGSLGMGAVLSLIWFRPWDVERSPVSFQQRNKPPNILLYAAMQVVETIAYYTALSNLSLLRVTMLTSLSTFWAYGIQSLLSKHAPNYSKTANFVAMSFVAVSFLIDMYLGATATGSAMLYGYSSIAVCILAAASRHEAISAVQNDADAYLKAQSKGLLLSAPISALLVAASYYYYADALTLPHGPELQAIIPSLALIALSAHIADPTIASSLNSNVSAVRHVSNAWPITVIANIVVGYIAFKMPVRLEDFVIAAVAYYGIGYIVHSDPRSHAEVTPSSYVPPTPSVHYKGKQPLFERLSTHWRHVRSYVKTILANPDSRKIYFFLCLNLAFMFIQMLYGIWTNSLGLISDSIHMFFDCLALAMGLFASVMATWPSDESFTYGYNRVETLSGFANGIFLILISVFIIFEAVERLLDPPEMNTNQLLVVSCLGLAVNLVGMVSTGHHHHHGHSHGHSHDHSHGSSCSHDDDHSHGHHGHSHNMKGVFLHVMADTLGSVGVIISTLLINRYGWTGFDPIASIFIAVLIFASVVPLVTDAAAVLCLDVGEEREPMIRKALTELNSIQGLASYSSPRFWPKDSETIIGSIHIQLEPSPSPDHSSRSQHSSGHFADAEKVMARVEKTLKKSIAGLRDLCIQVEDPMGCGCILGS